ncbi:MAG: divergent polysaccharide deacetylase family protein [Alphaproteobacteria bacterium]|nr:divergent polysaccharide deacetylase family protein [Alphaproteobacteria bacterium]
MAEPDAPKKENETSDAPPMPPVMAPADPMPERHGPSLLTVAWALLIAAAGGFAIWINVNPAPPDMDLGPPVAAEIAIPPAMPAKPMAEPMPPPAPMAEAPKAEAEPMPAPAPATPPPAAMAPETPPAAVAMPAPMPAPAPPRPAPPREQAGTPAPAAPVQSEAAPAPAMPAAPPPPPQQAARAPQGRPAAPPLPPRDVEAPTWVRFARPFDPEDKRPRIALVIADLGKSQAATNAAIQNLSGAITLAFTPYADGLAQWVALARAAGHEVLLSLPMEPADFPNTDPGPQTLLTTLSPRQNNERLTWTLERAQGYVGIVNAQGSRYTTSTDAMRPVIDRLFQRGLLFVDARTASNSVAIKVADDVGVPRAYADRLIDMEASRPAIDRALADLERLARQNGAAMGIAQTYPVTFERLINWLPQLEQRGIALAPVSAIVNRQPAPGAPAMPAPAPAAETMPAPAPGPARTAPARTPAPPAAQHK